VSGGNRWHPTRSPANRDRCTTITSLPKKPAFGSEPVSRGPGKIVSQTSTNPVPTTRQSTTPTACWPSRLERSRGDGRASHLQNVGDRRRFQKERLFGQRTVLLPLAGRLRRRRATSARIHIRPRL